MFRKALFFFSQILFFFTVWFLWPRELDSYLMGSKDRLAVPDYAMSNARYVSVKDGAREIESVAKDATFDLIERRMFAKEMHMKFYNEKGEVTNVTSDRGTFLMDPRLFHLEGNVRSLSPDGFLLKGEEAQYKIREKILYSPTPMEGEMEEKGVQLWGDKAESNLNTNLVNVMGNARVHYKEKKRGLTKVRGDRALLARDEEKVEFFDNVMIEQDKMQATGKLAQLYYSRDINSVKYMSVQEDVRIQQPGGRYTRSQVAEFYAPTDTIVLSGFPSVYDGEDAVNGDKITLYRATGVVEVIGTNAAASADPKLKGKEPQNKSLTEEDKELIP